MCNVEQRAVIVEKDREFSIYEVPESLRENKLDEIIVERFGLCGRPARIRRLDAKCSIASASRCTTVTIGLVGKYVRHQDAYKSVYEALTHAGIHHHSKVKVVPIKSDDITQGRGGEHPRRTRRHSRPRRIR